MSDTQAFTVPALPLGDAHAGGEGTDVTAPLIFDAWYVIALRSEVDRTLRQITALGQPLVHYRTEDGRPVVLDDRCLHRRAPLSRGKLVGDTVQCGYHGFTYAPTGQCLWAPGLPTSGERGTALPFGVRAYPCAERGPWLWVWMGRPERADPADIPLPDIDARPGAHVCGYKLNPANYMMLIENLLDLSHLHFLHAAADLAHVAVLPKEAPPRPDGVGWTKTIERTELGLTALMFGDDPKRLVRQVDESHQYGPSLTVGVRRHETLPGDLEPVRPASMHVVHALTPVDECNTHQFFMTAMSDPYVMPLDEVRHILQDIVFEQDVDVLRPMQVYVDGDTRPGRVEFSMAYDTYGLKMRRILKGLKARELAAAAPHSQEEKP